LLLFWFSLSLIVPLLQANEESNLPACCRRAGAHGCNLRSARYGDPSVPGYQASAPRCPYYPGSASTSQLGAYLPPVVRIHARNHVNRLAPQSFQSFHPASVRRAQSERGPPPIQSC